jgi:hypothetical protein
MMKLLTCMAAYWLTRWVVLADVLIEIVTLGLLDMGPAVELTADWLERVCQDLDPPGR